MRLRTLLFVFVSIVIPATLLAQTQQEVFDVNVYEGIYPDLLNAFGINTSSAQSHWVNWGLPMEGRRASFIFDPVYYIAHNPGVPTSYLAALQDFMNNGLPAGKRGSLEFDVKSYLARYSDLAAHYGTDYVGAADHFLNWGLPCEGRQGSADFAVQDYISMYPDVSAGYPRTLSCASGSTDYRSAMMHWLRRGKAFGRHGFGSFPVNPECSNGQTVEFGTVPASGAFNITVGQASSFTSDASVFYMNPPQGFGAQLTRVASSPAQGQYSVSAGVYTFNSADKEQPVKITYNLNPVPANYQRIFFADPANFQGVFGDGSSQSSPLRPDRVVWPSHPVAFNLDYQLRCRIEGGSDCTQDGIPFRPTNLIVCLAPGNYLTDGEYDWIFNRPHTAGSNLGFTLGAGWHFHGSGLNQTFLKLNSYVLISSFETQGRQPGSGFNSVFGTHTDASSDNIEISDLFIDANYPALHNLHPSVLLDLMAITLRSDGGGHNIHHIDAVNVSSETERLDIKFEGFPIIIISASGLITPSQSPNNQIKYVLMSGFSPPPGGCTGITVAHVLAEVAFNVVNNWNSTYNMFGACQGFGGFDLQNTWFHDNIAYYGTNGFLTDSGTNSGVVVEFNQIISPLTNGMVVGGGNVNNNYRIQYNNISLSPSNQNGILFNGNVASAIVTNNNITLSGSSSGPKGLAYQGSGNVGSNFEFNQIWDTLSNTVSPGNCVFNNWDEVGNPLSSLPNTQDTQCPPPTPR
jgi:hypothetical protein